MGSCSLCVRRCCEFCYCCVQVCYETRSTCWLISLHITAGLILVASVGRDVESPSNYEYEYEDEDEVEEYVNYDDLDDYDDFGLRVPELCFTLSDKKCKFPFVYDKVVYKRCTYAGGSPLPWCALEMNSKKVVIPGRWEDCKVETGCRVGCKPGKQWQFKCNTCTCTEKGTPSCTKKNCGGGGGGGGGKPEKCRVVSGSAVGQDCVFPFKWSGKTHYGCTPWKYGAPHDGKSWCSTRTDRDDNHVNGGGHFGFCERSCTEPYDESEFIDRLVEKPPA